ncbi:MAG: hypothetical protein ACK47C_15890 [Paracoccaceae bacterium]
MSEGFHHPRSSGFALFLAISLAGCATTDDRPPLSPHQIYAPEGAVAPPGLGEIRAGMTQREVLRILRRFHKVTHAADASPDMPIMDVFQYVEEGTVKYGEIFYEGDRVTDVRYGFSETFVFAHE